MTDIRHLKCESSGQSALDRYVKHLRVGRLDLVIYSPANEKSASSGVCLRQYVGEYLCCCRSWTGDIRKGSSADKPWGVLRRQCTQLTRKLTGQPERPVAVERVNHALTEVIVVHAGPNPDCGFAVECIGDRKPRSKVVLLLGPVPGSSIDRTVRSKGECRLVHLSGSGSDCTLFEEGMRVDRRRGRLAVLVVGCL